MPDAAGGPDSADETESRRRDLMRGSRLLFQDLGNCWGHIAVRLPGSYAGGFMLKHIRVPPPPLDPESIMVFDGEGSLVEGERALPFEVPLYVELFRARQDVQSVVHTHPLLATAVSMAGKTLFAISNDTALFEQGIPVFPGDVIHTRQLGMALAQTLGTWPAALMKGHGAVAVGPSIAHAVQVTLLIEQAARQIIAAATLGTVEVLEQRVLEFQRNPPRGEGALALWYTKLHFAGLSDPPPEAANDNPVPVYDVGVG